jgi:ketosteroid isomerase-like protein
MSQESVETVRSALEAFNETVFNPTKELDLRLVDPEIVWDNTNATFDGGVYRGHDGLREYGSLLRGMWKRQRFEPSEFIPAGADQVVVPLRLVSVGRDEIETVAQVAVVATLRAGSVTHVKAFQSKAEALEAVGLRE